MSRSYHKSNTMHHAFINCVCYFSNKKDKRICNRMMRRIGKHLLKVSKINNDLENFIGPEKTREILNNWEFSSDGLRRCFIFNSKNSRHYWSIDEIKKIRRK